MNKANSNELAAIAPLKSQMISRAIVDAYGPNRLESISRLMLDEFGRAHATTSKNKSRTSSAIAKRAITVSNASPPSRNTSASTGNFLPNLAPTTGTPPK